MRFLVLDMAHGMEMVNGYIIMLLTYYTVPTEII